MSTLFAMQVLLFAGELFVASTLIVVAARFFAVRGAASRRHLVWLAAFGMLLVLPVLVALAPSLVQFMLPAPAMPVPEDLTVAAAAVAPEPSEPMLDAATIVYLMIALWLAGVGWVALRGAAAALGLHALRRQSEPHRFGHLPVEGPRCELRVSTTDEDCGPVTWGIFRPVILLPRSSAFWPRERLEAVLRHELAHIGRRDSLAQMLSLIACALYWPNPLVWMAARRMRREAEISADDAVIVSGVKPSAYASELLELASEFQSREFSPAMPLHMAERSSLEDRVKSVLAPTQSRSGVTSMDVLKITCAGLLATTALVLARPSLAQDVAAPPAPPAVTSQPLPPPAPAAAPDAPQPPDAAIPAPPTAPAALASPPAPAELAAPPAPSSADMAPLAPPDDDVQVQKDVRRLNGREVQRVRIIVQRATERAHEALERARPQIERAEAEVKAREIELKTVQPRIDEAMRAAQPDVDRALRDAQPQIDAAMKDVGPEVEKAMAEARAEIAKADIDLKLKMRIDEKLKRVQIRIEQREAHEKHDGAHDHVVIEDDESSGTH